MRSANYTNQTLHLKSFKKGWPCSATLFPVIQQERQSVSKHFSLPNQQATILAENNDKS
ncbi:Uncharacterized protein ChrSV_0578 [Chromobacterium vaccinii]|nr:Uncharacterized protein ChrSW_0578 [Chromobacterium vaccinii]QND88037.1 Uncharacterized protein ChrSV_0578 [Chromobacterium vaccinii]